MTHEFNGLHASRRSVRGRSAKLITASTVALVAIVCHVSIAGHGDGTHGAWAWRAVQPVPGSVNTPALEGCPIESPDGHYLFIASNRGSSNIDIWASYRAKKSDPWATPGKLPEPVNSEFDDFCPTPLTGGRLMFVSRRPSACGTGTADIYETRLDPALGWLPAQILPCATPDDVNSFAEEFSPSLVEADGRTILFFSSGREGVQKIYSSERQANGQWGAAVAVEELNSGFQDARPNVSHDGLRIVFDSTRDGGPPDIWTATRSKLSHQWSAPRKLGPDVNSAATESRPSLSRDGKRLHFGSTRVGNQSDIYVAERFERPGPPQ